MILVDVYQDVIVVLKVDYCEVKGFFIDYQKFVDKQVDVCWCQEFVECICGLLKVYMEIEEELIYLWVYQMFVKDDGCFVDEVEVEYVCVKDFIVQIFDFVLLDVYYDVWIKVLGEYVDYYVYEEEIEFFLKLKKMDMDLDMFGEVLLVCKEELMCCEGLIFEYEFVE